MVVQDMSGRTGSPYVDAVIEEESWLMHPSKFSVRPGCLKFTS
jgi:hypothetical protein